MQMAQPKGRVAYEPNSLAADSPRETTASGFRSATSAENGERGRVRSESFADHYSQARLFYRSQTAYEQAHIASALVFELSKVDHLHVRQAMVAHLRNIDEDLARRIANGLGMDALPAAAPPAAAVKDMEPSPALQIIGKMLDTLQGRTIGILVADGSDGSVVQKLRKAATDAGATVKIVAPKVGGAKLADGSLLEADGQLQGTPSVVFDAVAIVLSAQGAQMLSKESAAIDFVSNAFVHLKAIAATDSAKTLLDMANVVLDAGVVDAADVKGFVAAACTRQWDREASIRMLA
jgi:catalase